MYGYVGIPLSVEFRHPIAKMVFLCLCYLYEDSGAVG